ncbi:DUF6503 family protein [Aliifodinibius sp. S!AR15-10]|uniref:DUF6503 family protein n=1 Tax=Aliifodinibius sp. S!AR15-10 TaxID=2950437 RepID=UPI00285B325B|nr:DUF6503 family protein [Aliifodinibius sp. S!AR15-10]MDR8389570.1 DUF6503 family protein [Aliifodinibius sp. S!AR15-10]
MTKTLIGTIASMIFLVTTINYVDRENEVEAFSTQAIEPMAESTISGSKLWERTINYHDPNHNWSNFSGKIHMVTTFSNGTFSQEELEIHNPDEFYQSTLLEGSSKAVKGVKKGECFNAVNGDENVNEEQINQYNIGCESAFLFKEHHTAHVGLPMELKVAGLKIQEELVEKVNFEGRECYALQLIGQSEEVRHPYWEGIFTMYTDVDTYAMHGFKREGGLYPGYFVAVGELELEGIRMPQVKNYFSLEDSSHLLTDVFTYVDAPK